MSNSNSSAFVLHLSRESIISTPCQNQNIEARCFPENFGTQNFLDP